MATTFKTPQVVRIVRRQVGIAPPSGMLAPVPPSPSLPTPQVMTPPQSDVKEVKAPAITILKRGMPVPLSFPKPALPPPVVVPSAVTPSITPAMLPKPTPTVIPRVVATPIIEVAKHEPQVLPPTHPKPAAQVPQASNLPSSPMNALMLPGQAPSQMQTMVQMFREQIHVQFKQLKSELEAKIDAAVKDAIASTMKQFKSQFETMEILGETLSDNTPVFNRPDPKTQVEHRIAKKGSKLKLFLPMTSNVHGYWATTPFVKPDGTVLAGYVLVFGDQLRDVDYGMSMQELKLKRDEWQGHLDHLSDKHFIPNVGVFRLNL